MTGQDFQRLTVRAAHLRNIGALVTRAAYRVEVHGRHHVPTEGPVLLVAPGLNLVSAGIVASVARRPLHTLAPWASPALGDIPVISPGIGAARWAVELLAGGAAIMVTTSVPPIGYLLAHGPMSIISVVVIGGRERWPMTHPGCVRKFRCTSVHRAPSKFRRICLARLIPVNFGTLVD